jgi:hypothetical protein
MRAMVYHRPGHVRYPIGLAERGRRFDGGGRMAGP